LLGQALCERLTTEGASLAAAPRGRSACDIGEAPAVDALLRAARPDVVFNAAAYTDVDGAERNPAEAERVNARGPEHLARACAALGARFVHFSTDFVFDGESPRPHVESDPPSPRSAYARSKVAGDERVLAAWPRSAVIRVGCLYGRGGRNFPSQILARLRAGQRLRVDAQRRASPTWAVEAARVCTAVARTEAAGVIHATADGETTWAQFATFLAATAGLREDLVEALPTAALGLGASRPRAAILDNGRLRALGLDTLGDWREQARAYVAAEFAETRMP
jgi:dTDP-4-dehydrorhamnose reductase